MSEHMDRNREVFREEAYELIAEMETTLLELEASPSDRELVGRVFRAMHTLKGSGSMFGYGEIADFTHEIENVYDLVRNGEMEADKGLVDLTLSSLDQVRAMLEADRSGVRADSAKTGKIIERFRSMRDHAGAGGGHAHAPNRAVPSQKAPGRHATYRINFAPHPGVFNNGLNPLALIRDLSELGECRVVARPEGVPPLWDMKPDTCYTRWEAELTTDRGMGAVKDVFMFIEDGCDLSVSKLDVGMGMPAHAVMPSRDPKKAVPSAVKTARGHGHSASMRVDSSRLDVLTDLVGELVTAQARLSQTAALHKDPVLTKITEDVKNLTEELRNNTLELRMVPFGITFTKFKRLARDLGRELGKDVLLVTEGAETELDKTVMEKIDDPIVHIIRNSLGHGIETPEERERAGKPRQGTIVLSAVHSGGNVLIRIKDDGAGVDLDKVREKAVEKGLISPDAEPGERELLALLFAPGFSTAHEVTGVSGRGVGMDVVKRRIESLRGAVEITSREGAGMEVALRLPLTLAIIDGLLVGVGDGSFVLPLSTVIECVELDRDRTALGSGRRLISVRGELVPYINIREQLGIPGMPPRREHVVIISDGGRQVGLAVDSVIGGRQTVIKPLGRVYKEVEGVSGATVLGDGRVALILNVPKLVELAEKEEAGV